MYYTSKWPLTCKDSEYKVLTIKSISNMSNIGQNMSNIGKCLKIWDYLRKNRITPRFSWYVTSWPLVWVHTNVIHGYETLLNEHNNCSTQPQNSECLVHKLSKKSWCAMLCCKNLNWSWIFIQFDSRIHRKNKWVGTSWKHIVNEIEKV